MQHLYHCMCVCVSKTILSTHYWVYGVFVLQISAKKNGKFCVYVKRAPWYGYLPFECIIEKTKECSVYVNETNSLQCVHLINNSIGLSCSVIVFHSFSVIYSMRVYITDHIFFLIWFSIDFLFLCLKRLANAVAHFIRDWENERKMMSLGLGVLFFFSRAHHRENIYFNSGTFCFLSFLSSSSSFVSVRRSKQKGEMNKKACDLYWTTGFITLIPHRKE